MAEIDAEQILESLTKHLRAAIDETRRRYGDVRIDLSWPSEEVNQGTDAAHREFRPTGEFHLSILRPEKTLT